MCGLTGFWQLGGFSASEATALATAMAQRIAHRGPNDSGVWIDAGAGLALAFRRLSILDLSSAGHQPMVSASGRYVIVFNGEIYNYLQLRSELEGEGSVAWRGHSDTETLLAGFEAWGVEATLKKTVGMFAIALWDRAERTLYLARDRMGEKPLYYGWQNDVFLFGSELKALRAHPAFRGEIDRDAITLLLRHNCIPAPYSIYQGIRKLLPGTYLKFLPGQRDGGPTPYWSLREVVEQGQAQPFSGSESEAVTALETHLLEAIGLQMIADVPLGAFLSGGIDSSTIVALMQAQSSQPVKTFTIGSHQQGYNEAEHAKAVARHLGTVHTELYVTPNDAMNVIPRLPTLYDEPFSDSSQIPTFLVSQMAKQHVTVSLSGDAGDELFGGYNRYSWASSISRMRRIPPPLRKLAAAGLSAFSPRAWDRLYSPVSELLPSRLHMALPGDKAHKLADLLAGGGSPEEIYRGLVSHWKQPTDIVIGATEPSTALRVRANWPTIHEFEQRMMYLDAMSYLPDDILVKVDRAAMGVSLETRVPFLDHRVVQFAWQLPMSMKIRQGQGKWILRQVLYKYVPRELMERPKMGFGVPIDSWLRGPLRDWAEGLLDESRLRQEGFFNPRPIRKMWAEHLSGHRNLQYPLWDVLTFQAWLESAEDVSQIGQCSLQLL
ncbi:MAG: asparagine synthase (glutamine-hydrolyzing) [Acidobacteriaceae bacterium]